MPKKKNKSEWELLIDVLYCIASSNYLYSEGLSDLIIKLEKRVKGKRKIKIKESKINA